MKKNGFIFVETIVVLVIVVLSLSMVLASYSLITRKNNINKYYNRPNEVYALYYIMKLGTTDSNNYINGINRTFYTSRSTCNTSKMGTILNGETCKTILNDMNIINIGVIENVSTEIAKTDGTYDSGTIEFLKHLQKQDEDEDGNKINIPYAIGVFYINREYYYASLRISGD